MSPADIEGRESCESCGAFTDYGEGLCSDCFEAMPEGRWMTGPEIERVRMNPGTVIVHTSGSVRGSDIEDRNRLTAWEWVTLTVVTLAGVAVAGIVGTFALDLLWLYLGAVASLGEAVGR